MEKENLTIFLIPNLQSIAAEYGYDLDNEDAWGNAALFAQGYDTEGIEVEPGEEFIISKKYIRGEVDGDTSFYKFKKNNPNEEHMWEDMDEEPREINLPPGKYYFHEDAITIEELDDDDYEDDDYI